jgi:hypothetical protein
VEPRRHPDAHSGAAGRTTRCGPLGRQGTAIGIKTADKLAYAYNNALSDGTEVCVGIAMYSFKTDANGNVYYSDSAVISEFNSAHLTSPIWKTGIFDPTTLTGFDAAAKVDMFGRTLQNGFVQIG